MLHRIVRLAAILFVAMAAIPAQARVTITFWSYEHGGNFPHAFFTIHGVPDRGGKPVKISYGFTPKTVTPAMLMGTVAGRLDPTSKSYVATGFAHFSTPISDQQYDAVMRMVSDWGPEGDSRYSLNKRNCVHFSAEAMRRSGLRVVEDKKLMKKPRSFTNSIAALNAGRVTPVNLGGAAYTVATPAMAGIGK